MPVFAPYSWQKLDHKQLEAGEEKLEFTLSSSGVVLISEASLHCPYNTMQKSKSLVFFSPGDCIFLDFIFFLTHPVLRDASGVPLLIHPSVLFQYILYYSVISPIQGF